MTAWREICAKELKETLRDRRTLLLIVVVPVLLYPLLLIAMEQLLLLGQRNLEADAAPVAIVGDAPPDFLDLVDRAEGLVRVGIGPDIEAALRRDEVTAVAIVGPPAEEEGTREVQLIFDASSDRSNRGRGALSSVLAAWRDDLVAERLGERSLPSTFARPLAVADSSIARPEEVGGYTLGRVLPLLLVVITLLGTFYPAIDLAAGEKERGTLETLLTAPVPPRAVVAGKFVTVALIGIIAAALNLGSMLLTFQTGLVQFSAAADLEFTVPLRSALVIFTMLVPLAVFFGALFLGIAVGASSFKEAQNTLTPVYMVVLIPAMLPLFPGIDSGPLLAIVPVAGVAFLFRDLMTGDADVVLGLMALLSTTLYAVLALSFAANSFGNERVLFGNDGSDAEVARGSILQRWRARRQDEGPVPTPQAAIIFVAFVAVIFFWGGIQLQYRYGEAGLLAAEWLLLGMPALLIVALSGLDPVRTLSLRRPSMRQLGGGVLLIAGAMPIVWLIGWLQTWVLPVPWEMLEGFEELITARSFAEAGWLLLVLAVTPAICEELVFRGVLLGGTKTLVPWRMILLNGVVFGAFHLSYETVIRFLPTATLGIVIAWAVWRTGSIMVGMLMHVLNNGFIVLLASIPFLRGIFGQSDAPPLWMLPIAVLLFTVGARTLMASPAHGHDLDHSSERIS